MTVFHKMIRNGDGGHGKPVDEIVISEVSQEFLDRIPGGILRYPDDGVEALDYVNQTLIEIFGCDDLDDFMAYTGNTFPGLVHEDDVERVQREIHDQIYAGNKYDQVRFRIRRKDGEIRWIEDRGKHVQDSDGMFWYYVTLIDVTDEMYYRERLELSNERLEMLAAMSNDIIFDVDQETKNVQIFGDFRKRFGRDPQVSDFALLRRTNDVGVSDIETMSLCKPLRNLDDAMMIDFEVALPTADGEPQWCRYQSLIRFDEKGVPSHRLGRLLDTHEMTLRKMKYQQMAERDGLTNVLNRETAIRRIEEKLEASTGACTFMIVDVDDFKSVNDTFGHPTGDAVLADLARHLRSCVRSDDVVARFGGDEFVLFLDTMGEGEARERIANRVVGTGLQPVTGENNGLFQPSVSVGVATMLVNDRGKDAFADLYREADRMLYTTKQRGKAGVSMTTLR